MAKKPLPTPEQLRQLLDCDPETGDLTWKARTPDMFSDGGHGAVANAKTFNGKCAGKPALSAVYNHGYKGGHILGRGYLAHRVIVALRDGAWPDMVDHIDGNPLNNQPSNLRAVTATENAKNSRTPRTNTSGHRGVRMHSMANRWVARIKSGGKEIHLGLFDTMDEAIAARKAAEARLGFHPNHGRT